MPVEINIPALQRICCLLDNYIIKVRELKVNTYINSIMHKKNGSFWQFFLPEKYSWTSRKTRDHLLTKEDEEFLKLGKYMLEERDELNALQRNISLYSVQEVINRIHCLFQKIIERLTDLTLEYEFEIWMREIVVHTPEIPEIKKERKPRKPRGKKLEPLNPKRFLEL